MTTVNETHQDSRAPASKGFDDLGRTGDDSVACLGGIKDLFMAGASFKPSGSEDRA